MKFLSESLATSLHFIILQVMSASKYLLETVNAPPAQLAPSSGGREEEEEEEEEEDDDDDEYSDSREDRKSFNEALPDDELDAAVPLGGLVSMIVDILNGRN